MATSGGPRPNRRQFICDDWMWQWIGAHAQETGATRSEVIRDAVSEKIDREAVTPGTTTHRVARKSGVVREALTEKRDKEQGHG